MEGGGTSLSAGVHISHLLNQHLSNLYTVVKDSIMQRLLVLFVLVVHIGYLVLIFKLIK